MLKSQEMRKLAPEMDPLRIGTGWKKEDLEKPQIMVESTYGDSHPGSGHLNLLVEEVRKGVAEAGGFGARYFCTDICDGESQGTDGINYSLASREMIANMIEIHANATPFDGGVYLSSCDKGMPGNLIGLARVDIPAVVVPGGTMNAGPEMLTLEQLGMYSAKFERGEIDEEKLDWAKCNACPSCGACSFIGTASTMQIMAEALGLALPGSALMPATSPDLLAYAREAGRQAVKLAQMEHMRPSDLVTKESFENAILVHAAISGSTNCLLHIPAIAHEFGIEITGDTFDRLHRNARYLLDVRPAGRWPAECFYYAGGVPAIMEEIKDHLLSLGLPEDILNDLAEEDLLECKNARQVFVERDDYPMNDGVEVVSGTEGYTQYSTEYPQKELKLSGAAIELEQKGQWKVIHHFRWNEDPGFRGTESLQIYPVYSGQKSGWTVNGGLTGQVLYEKNGTSYTADYAVLQNENYNTRDGFPFYDMMEHSSIFAEFSMPRHGENYCGYVAYEIKEKENDWWIDSWLNYTHQNTLVQYPVLSAAQSRKQGGVMDGRMFTTVQNALQVLPGERE